MRSRLEGRELSSAGIDAAVREADAAGETLYYLEQELLEEAAPDVIFTQHVCDVCQIGTAYVERAVATLPKVPELVPLVPKRLADVEDNLRAIAGALDVPGVADAHIEACRARLDAVVDRLREVRAPVRSVSFIEWIDPLFHCGHWIPDQLALAGGADAMASPGGHSQKGQWDRLRHYDPEVIVVAPCGFDVPRAKQEGAVMTAQAGYAELRAVKARRVYVVDADLFTQPSLTTLVDGVELLAHLLHPAHVPAPAGFDRSCAKLD